MKPYDQHRAKRSRVRIDQVAAGYFDGRFVERSVPSKKQYTRKLKHKNKEL